MSEEDKIRNLMMLDYSQLIMYTCSLEELNDINHKEIERLKEELKKLKVKERTIYFYTTPTYKKRVKAGKNRREIIILD